MNWKCFEKRAWSTAPKSIKECLIIKQIRQRENSGGSEKLIAGACCKDSKRQVPERWKLDVPLTTGVPEDWRAISKNTKAQLSSGPTSDDSVLSRKLDQGPLSFTDTDHPFQHFYFFKSSLGLNNLDTSGRALLHLNSLKLLVWEPRSFTVSWRCEITHGK